VIGDRSIQKRLRSIDSERRAKTAVEMQKTQPARQAGKKEIY